MESSVAAAVSQEVIASTFTVGASAADRDGIALPEHGLLQHWPEPWTKKQPRMTLHASREDWMVTICGRKGHGIYRWLGDWPTGHRIYCDDCFKFAKNPRASGSVLAS